MEIKQRCTETVIIVKLANGKCKILRALLDSGCTKTIILREFTEQGNRIKLPPSQQITYKTYGGRFRSNCIANVQLKFIEFAQYKHNVFNCEVQVDELKRRSETKYDIVIGTDLMNDLNIVLDFADNQITMGKGKENDAIPMKELDVIDIAATQVIHNMHIDSYSPMLQQEEERQRKILDADYSKEDIDAMVKELDITEGLKIKLKYMLNNHE